MVFCQSYFWKNKKEKGETLFFRHAVENRFEVTTCYWKQAEEKCNWKKWSSLDNWCVVFHSLVVQAQLASAAKIGEYTQVRQKVPNLIRALMMRPRKNVLVAKFFSEIHQHWIFTTDMMELLTNLFFLAHQLKITSGLRVLDNGLGPAVFGAEEEVIDYALLAKDQKAALPSQVQDLWCFW